MVTIEQYLKKTEQLQEKQKVMTGILYASTLLTKNLETILEPFNLSPPQYNVLLTIHSKFTSPVTQKEIAASIIDKKSDVSRIVARLENAGFLQSFSSPNIDKRAKYVILTQQGLDVIRQIEEQNIEMEKSISGMSDEEASLLNVLIQKMLDQLIPKEVLPEVETIPIMPPGEHRKTG